MKVLLSFHLKTQVTPRSNWWQRVLGVTPRPALGWVRRSVEAEFTTVDDATAFLGTLQRPEIVRGVLGGEPPLWGVQLEWGMEPTPYIITSSTTPDVFPTSPGRGS